jgi:Acetyltransferase (GNAT) domain
MKKINEALIHKSEACNTQIISTLCELKSHTDEIIDFLANDAEEHDYAQHPNFILAEYMRNPKLKPFIIVLRHQGKIFCIAFASVCTKRFNLAFSVLQLPAPKTRILNFSGSGFVFQKKCIKNEAIQKVLTALQTKRRGFDIISLSEIDLASPFWQYLTQKCKNRNSFFNLTNASPKQEIISWHELHQSYEDWYRSLRGKTRKSISWEKNRLQKRAPQPVRVKRIETEEEVPEFLHDVNNIRKNSWQGKTFGPSPYTIEEDIIFFKQMARNGWLRSYLLLCNDRPIAYELSIQYNRECIFLERGYNQDFHKLAPGTYLTYHIVQDCYEYSPPRSINFGFGENEFKKRLRTKTKNSCYAYLTKPGRWRLLVILQLELNFIENKISKTLKKVNLDRYIRKILKSKK